MTTNLWWNIWPCSFWCSFSCSSWWASKNLKEQEIDSQETRFCCLDGTNSISGEILGLQRRIRHISHHSMYVNCRCHRLPLCFKHLIDQFSCLAKLDKLLLGLWKSFHYSALNCTILTEIQKAYGTKTLRLVKAVFTRWLSHGAACKRCLEWYKEILEALEQVLVAKPNPEINRYRSDLLEPSTVLELVIGWYTYYHIKVVSAATIRSQRFQSNIWRCRANLDHTERNVRRSKPCWVRKFEEISSLNGEVMQSESRKYHI